MGEVRGGKASVGILRQWVFFSQRASLVATCSLMETRKTQRRFGSLGGTLERSVSDKIIRRATGSHKAAGGREGGAFDDAQALIPAPRT